MLGVRLEVDAMIVTSPILAAQLIRCINRAGINVTAWCCRPWPYPVSLSADEKDLRFPG